MHSFPFRAGIFSQLVTLSIRQNIYLGDQRVFLINPYLTHTINIHLKTICCALKNLRVALHLEK